MLTSSPHRLNTGDSDRSLGETQTDRESRSKQKQRLRSKVKHLQLIPAASE